MNKAATDRGVKSSRDNYWKFPFELEESDGGRT